MVRKWKEEYAPRVLVINGKVVSANENEIDTSFPPSKYIKSGERWCPYHNPESFGKIVHLSIIKELKCYSWIYENIIKYLNNSPFYLRQLRDIVDINEISDGDRLRKILHYMVCIGILKNTFETVNASGKELKNQDTSLNY